MGKRDFSHEAMVAAFWARVAIGEPDECWLWKNKLNEKGYGRFCWNKTVTMAHRVAYEITNGPLPEGIYACHSCDNPACCNPNHLWGGTIGDNNRDMFAKGRGNILDHAVNDGCFGKGRRDIHGEKHPMAKLNWDKVREMRWLRARGLTIKEIAGRFGISIPHTHKIVVGEAWKEESL